MTHAELMQLTTRPLLRRLLLWLLRRELRAMEAAAGHFADMASAGHRGHAWAHKMIANLKPQIVDAENADDQ